jgi:hypothetical protein
MADGGFGGGRSPSNLLDEPTFYFNVKTVINRAEGDIERYKKKQEKRKNGRRT